MLNDPSPSIKMVRDFGFATFEFCTSKASQLLKQSGVDWALDLCANGKRKASALELGWIRLVLMCSATKAVI